MRKTPLLPVILALFMSLAGCSTVYVSKEEFAHMISIDEQGGPADVRPRDQADRVMPHPEHVGAIVDAFHAWQEQDRGKHRRMLLVIHGGLVSMATAVEEAKRSMAAMQQEGVDFFPVFVNWETGLFQSYFDHLLRVRQGRRRTATALFTAPFVFAYDFGRALVRYPITMWAQLENFRDYYYYGDGKVEERPASWAGQAELDPEETDRDWTSTLADLGVEVVPGVLRLATTPILDGAGVSSFQNMRRRARMLIRRDADFGQTEDNATGALSLLMHELIRRTGKRGDKRPVQLDIIGHSMGCIVANRIIREFGYRPHPLSPDSGPSVPALQFRDIVFMGAACTIREFADTTLHYVLHHEDARFFNLCLHPRDEEDDLYAYGVLPHGSLLEWIDDYITVQSNEMDRTLGKWNNVARVLRVMDWIPRAGRARIHVRAFARTAGNPRDHGDFNDVRFGYWRESFWMPKRAGRSK